MATSRDLVFIQDLSAKDVSCTGGNIRVKFGSFVNDETGGNAPVAGASPANPPTTPKDGATVAEIYNDLVRYWTYDAATTAWTHVTDVSPCTQITNCVATATAVDDTVTGAIEGQRVTGGVSANDTLCSVGNTTFTISGAPTNCTIVFFDQSSGVYTIIPSAAGAFSFTYELRCNGTVIDTATVSGTAAAITATATADSLAADVLTGFVGDNDTGCSSGITRYKLTGATTNGSVSTFNQSTGAFAFTPTQDGAWSFGYEIYCVMDNTEYGPVSSATVSGSYSGDLCNCSGAVSATNGAIRVNSIAQPGAATSRTLRLDATNVSTPSTTFDVDWGDGTTTLGSADLTVLNHTYAAVGATTPYVITVTEPTGSAASQFYLQLTAGGQLQWLDSTALAAPGSGGTVQATTASAAFRACPGSETADVSGGVYVRSTNTTGFVGLAEMLIDGQVVQTVASYDSNVAANMTALNAWTIGSGTQLYELRFSLAGITYARCFGTLTVTC